MSPEARGAVPSPEAIAHAAERSPLTRGPRMSELADALELRYREEVERYDDPPRNIVEFIEGKELESVLGDALAVTGLRPGGVVVELGAGSCWLSSALAARPEVERVVSIEFSDRRLVELAPVALARSGAPPEKVERRVADFYDHGLDDGIADYVFTDASFHHAADPARLAGVIAALLKPGGCAVLLREPTLAVLRRNRDHGEEGKHGSFEREYDSRGYLSFLAGAGLEASKHPVRHGFRSLRDRAIGAPPLSWLTGILFSRYVYVGRKPANPSRS